MPRPKTWEAWMNELEERVQPQLYAYVFSRQLRFADVRVGMKQDEWCQHVWRMSWELDTPTPMGLDSLDLSIKSTLNKVLEILEALKNLRFMTQEI